MMTRPLFVFLLLLGSACSGGNGGEPQTPDVLRGLDFSPYIDGQDPNQGASVSLAQVADRMGIVAGFTEWIRGFGSTRGIEHVAQVGRALGLCVAASAWLGPNRATNGEEIDGLIQSASAGDVDLAIVGSEVLLRHDLGDGEEEELIAYMQRVREAVGPLGVRVTTADVYSVLLDHPRVMEAGDIVFANYYPFWEGVPIERAIGVLGDWHQRMVAAAGGKEVWVSETGWPSEGDPVGEAVPSPENAALYLRQFVSWARSAGVRYFYFIALDETWKARYEGSRGAHWGIWDKNGNLKTGMEQVVGIGPISHEQTSCRD